MDRSFKKTFSTFVRSLIFNLAILQGVGSMCADPTLPSSTGVYLSQDVGQIDVTNLINYTLSDKLANHKFRDRLIQWSWDKITAWLRKGRGVLVCHTSCLYSDEVNTFNRHGCPNKIGLVMQNVNLAGPYVELRLAHSSIGNTLEVIDTTIKHRIFIPGCVLSFRDVGIIPHYERQLSVYTIINALDIPETFYDGNNFCKSHINYINCPVPTREQLDQLFCDDLLWLMKANEEALSNRMAYNRSGRDVLFYHIGSLWEEEFIIIRAERYLYNVYKVALIVLDEGFKTVEERFLNYCGINTRYIITHSNGVKLNIPRCVEETFKKVDVEGYDFVRTLAKRDNTQVHYYMAMVPAEFIDDGADYFCRDLHSPLENKSLEGMKSLFL